MLFLMIFPKPQKILDKFVNIRNQHGRFSRNRCTYVNLTPSMKNQRSGVVMT